MGDRNMIVGDTTPPLRGEVDDATGSPLNLSGAVSLTVHATYNLGLGGTATFTGPAVADWPAIADADGIHHWNWHYNFAAGDTAVAGDPYNVELVVVFDNGPPVHQQTFGGPSITIAARKTT